MIKCSICSKDIDKDSQYINGKYYHNNCIENLVEIHNNTINFVKNLSIDSFHLSDEVLLEVFKKMMLKVLDNKEDDIYKKDFLGDVNE